MALGPGYEGAAASTASLPVSPSKHHHHEAQGQHQEVVASSEYERILKNVKSAILTQKEQAQPTLASQGMRFVRNFLTRSNFINLITASFRITIIFVAYMLVRRSINRVIHFYTRRARARKSTAVDKAHTISVMETVIPIIQSTLHWVIAVIAGLLILSELSINIMPIIYSFSVIGLAISIGSQTLVKDLINGLLTLFEGNIAVGDSVAIGGREGVVESLSLRCIHLRHENGELQTIPFSEVSSVVNRSRDFGAAVIRLMVGHTAPLDAVEQAIRDAYTSLQKDAYFGPQLKGDLNYKGVERIVPNAMEIEALTHVKLGFLKAVQKEFYNRAITNVQKAHIPMPFPARDD
jgi:small conductance mechanosensitive channel